MVSSVNASACGSLIGWPKRLTTANLPLGRTIVATVKAGKYLGCGVSREVVEFGKDKVLKRARKVDDQEFSTWGNHESWYYNLRETEVWQQVRNTSVAKYFAEVFACSEDGTTLIMERASYTMDSALESGKLGKSYYRACDKAYEIVEAIRDEIHGVTGIYLKDLHFGNIGWVRGKGWVLIDYAI